MKNIQLALVFTFLFAFGVQAQSVKTDEVRQLTELSKEITIAEKQVIDVGAEIAALLIQFTPEYSGVVSKKERLKELNGVLAALKSEKDALLRQAQIKALPTTAPALLKLIVMQNERIIDLLERLVSSNPLK